MQSEVERLRTIDLAFPDRDTEKERRTFLKQLSPRLGSRCLLQRLIDERLHDLLVECRFGQLFQNQRTDFLGIVEGEAKARADPAIAVVRPAEVVDQALPVRLMGQIPPVPLDLDPQTFRSHGRTDEPSPGRLIAGHLKAAVHDLPECDEAEISTLSL